jgi:hypothetical protein
MDIADSLYRQVITMWYNHLRKLVEGRTQISELDSILGIKDDDDMDKEMIGNVLWLLFFFVCHIITEPTIRCDLKTF